MFEIGTTSPATSYFATLLIARSILLWAFGLLERQVMSPDDRFCAGVRSSVSIHEFAFPTLLFAAVVFGSLLLQRKTSGCEISRLFDSYV